MLVPPYQGAPIFPGPVSACHFSVGSSFSSFGWSRFVSVCFDLFRFVSVCFGLFRFVSVCFGLFRFVSVCFGCFDLFRLFRPKQKMPVSAEASVCFGSVFAGVSVFRPKHKIPVSVVH